MESFIQTNSNHFPPVGFIKHQQNKIRKSKLSHFKFNGVAKISAETLDSGIRVHINNYSLKLEYPKKIWQRFPALQKKIFAENVAYSLTFHIPFVFPTLKKMSYSLPVPISEAFMYKCFTQQLPATAMMEKTNFGKKTSNLLRKFFYTEYVFNNRKTQIPPFNRISNKNNIVMPFTFGKDSLLTFGLLRELGVSAQPVFVAEPHYPYDEVLKKNLAEDFQREYKIKIEFLKNSLGILRDPTDWFGWETQLTQYSLLLLPYIYYTKAGYLLFSNEQSCDFDQIDKDGFRCNPVYEQSHPWLLQNSLLTGLVGGNSLSIGTLLEPVHEISIVKILHRRYPEIGKYQSSCDLEAKPKNGSRWCENCSKCARMFIFLLANGIDPKKVGFKGNLLTAAKIHLYPLFDPTRIKEYGYDNSEPAIKEQLLGFLLAYRRGVKGAAINLFKKKYLKQALSEEKQLRQIFFGIHSSTTVPYSFSKKILRIFHQELDKFH
ncbi:MAG: hypothetical protein M1120_01550 [Patescibacteria group bacterium]|nr:hypothetical protein [Patescibacteria group bacterium]